MGYLERLVGVNMEKKEEERCSMEGTSKYKTQEMRNLRSGSKDSRGESMC